MHLTNSEVERFYNLWFPLLHYVNQRRKLVPSFPQAWRDASVSPEVVVPLRNALWEDDALREAFIAENPAKLSQPDLTLIASWSSGLRGTFSSSAISNNTRSFCLVMTRCAAMAFSV